jgi:tRNA (guanine37-N1)-methyltransferase
MFVQVLTIFPELFDAFLKTSLIGRARERDLLTVSVGDLREFTRDQHHQVDDEPFGGGGGMVMMALPWLAAVRECCEARPTRPWRVLMSPQGQRLDEAKVRELASRPELLLMCGRYEGIDERVLELVVDEEISIGDFVVSGGELPAMVLIEALSRQIPGVVRQLKSVEEDSFRSGLLDTPCYTRPREIEGLVVPEVLLSGDHRKIEEWRRRAALRATWRKRPDLLAKAPLSPVERVEIERWGRSPSLAGPAHLQHRSQIPIIGAADPESPTPGDTGGDVKPKVEPGGQSRRSSKGQES